MCVCVCASVVSIEFPQLCALALYRERESERDFDGGEMGFFDASYGASEDEDEEEKNATVKATFTQTTTLTTTAKTTSTLPNPATFLEEKQGDDFLHIGRNDDDDDDDDETTRKRRDAHTIRRDAKMVVKKRIESKTEEEEEHGATTTFVGEEVTKATKAKRPKEKRQVEGGVKERERKKRQAGQNGRDTTEWKTEAEMVLRQQYD